MGTFIALVGLQGAGIRKAFRFTEKNEVSDTTLLLLCDGLGEDALELVDVYGLGDVVVHAGFQALGAVFG